VLDLRKVDIGRLLMKNNNIPKLASKVLEKTTQTTTQVISGGGQIGGQIGDQINLTNRQLEILYIIRENPKVNRKTIAEKLSINESAIQKHLKSLKDKGFLKRVGGTRGHWKVLK
jgi:DNA-binding MarR family transcriptional regulator